MQRLFLNLRPSIKTSMHIFDHTIKPILLYSSEIWGVFNPVSSKFRNGISLHKIFSNTEAEKYTSSLVYLFLECIAKRANFAVMSKLGRYPFYIDLIKAMLKY